METETKRQSKDSRLSEKHWMPVLALYRACLKNAEELIKEASLLYDHGCYARAFFLGISAYEEVGKSQIVADYFNGMVSKKEFDESFQRHDIKSAYFSRHFQLDAKVSGKATIVYDKKKVKEHMNWRNASLYVGYDADYSAEEPSKVVTSENAKTIIEAVKKEISDIHVAAFTTERIGSASFAK